MPFGGNPNGSFQCRGSLEPEEGPGGGSGGNGSGRSGSTVKLSYKHPLEWRIRYDEATRRTSVIRPSGSVLLFAAPAGNATAVPVGTSRKSGYRVHLLNRDLTPNTTGTPAYCSMFMPDGSGMRFNAATGRVDALLSATGIETTAEEYASHWQVTRRADTGDIESIWSEFEGLLQVVPAPGGLVLEHYAPQDVIRSGNSFSAHGTPIVTYTYEKWDDHGVSVLKTTRQSRGRQPFVTERRSRGENVTLLTGEGPERVIRTIEKKPLPGNKWEIVDTTRREGEEEPAMCVRTVKKNTPGGWLDISRTEGYGTELAQTAILTYNDQYRASLHIKPDGGYTRYEYDALGRIVLQASPWAGGGEKIHGTTYADLRFNDTRPETETEYIRMENGTETVLHKSTYSYEDGEAVLRITHTETAIGTEGKRTTVRELYGPGAPYAYARGRVKSVLTPDGIEQSYTYAPTTAFGATHCTTMTQTAGGRIVPGQSTRSIRYIRADGNVACEEAYVHADGEFHLVSRKQHDYDAEGHRCRTACANGRISTTEWMCTAPLSVTDEDGVVTTYSYDTARHQVESIRAATLTTPEIITSTTTDAAGRPLSVRTDTGAMHATTRTRYDILGRIVSETDALGRVTNRHYSDDGLEETVVTPSGATLVTRRNYDGTTASLEGSGQTNCRYTYEVIPSGIRQTTLISSNSTWHVSQRVTRNGFGEITLEEHANFNGGFIATVNRYNTAGRLVKTQTGDLAPTVSTYDSMGNRVKTIIVIDPADPENPLCNRVSETSYLYHRKEDGICQTQTNVRYDTEGNPLVTSTDTLISELDCSLESKTESTDPRGNTTVTRTEYGMGTDRTIRTSHSLVKRDSVRRVVDGFTVEETDHLGLRRKYSRAYTEKGIILRMIDPRGNTTTLETDIAGRETSRTDAQGNVTRTHYHPSLDQVASIITPDGNTINYACDLRGRHTAEWGTATRPLRVSYDDMGRIDAIETFRDENCSGNPEQFDLGDKTSWQYEENSGLPINKWTSEGEYVMTFYDDCNRVNFTGLPGSAVAEYAYSPGTGELASITYRDHTPGVSYTYDYLGRMTSVSDGAGTRTFEYDSYGALVAEMTSGEGIRARLDYKIDTRGREAGYKLTVGNQVIQDVDYAFDESSRIATALVNGVDEPFTWNYDALSGHVRELIYPTTLVRRDSYQPLCDLVAQIDYRQPGNVPSLVRHEYTYDAMMRPATQRDTWNASPLPTTHQFAHNSRGELISDALSNGDRFSYQYDAAGNRRNAEEPGFTTVYETNMLNHYVRITENGQDFTPIHSCDGIQMTLHTSTGMWELSYDAEIRATSFQSQDGATRIVCVYDESNRRRVKECWHNGTLVSRRFFIYKGYLLIAELDSTPGTATENAPAVLQSYFWDPVHTGDTRALMLTRWRQDAEQHPVVLEHLVLTHDNRTNVTALFDLSGKRRALYEYGPFGGTITQEGDAASLNPFRFSCEYADDELGLIAYNFRYYNPKDGRWISRDPLGENAGPNLYAFLGNRLGIDHLGLQGGFGDGGLPSTVPTVPAHPPYTFPPAENLGTFQGSLTAIVQDKNTNKTATVKAQYSGEATLQIGSGATADVRKLGLNLNVFQSDTVSIEPDFSVDQTDGRLNCCLGNTAEWSISSYKARASPARATKAF